MNDIFFLHPDFSLWLCLTLMHSLWIWTVIALFVFTADWLTKRVRVEKRYGFHLAALLIGLASLPLTFYYVLLRTAPVNSIVTLITAPHSTSVPTVTPAEKPGDHTFMPALPVRAPAPDLQSKETAQRFSPLPDQQAGIFISQWNWNHYLPWIAGGYLLGFSIIRDRYRDSDKTETFMTPGETYEFNIKLDPCANRFKKGHRIRVDISSSNFPRFELNTNTGEPANNYRRKVTATNTIFHDSQYHSHIVLPVVPVKNSAE